MANVKRNALPILLSFLLLILLILLLQQFLTDKFYPFTFVGDTNLSFLTQGQAIGSLQRTFQNRKMQKIGFAFAQGEFTVDLATSSATLDYSTLTAAFQKQHQEKIWKHLKSESVNPQINLLLDKQLDAISQSVSKPAKDAGLIFDESTGSARIQIKEAENGIDLNKEALVKQIQDFLLHGKYESQLPLKVALPKISTAYVNHAKEILESIASNPVKLTFAQESWTLDTKQLLTLLDFKTGESLLSKEQTKAYLSDIASEIDQKVTEGLFEFDPQNKRVVAFRPSQEGRKLNIDAAYDLIIAALTDSSNRTIPLPVEIVKPKIQTEDVNSLGIKELLGRGISNFAGSIDNRIYNVSLTASKINGVLVPPGETFSFNQTVGDISETTGFKKAYVIKEGRTVLDDGGGVCQGSTTLFRAVLNAGLPVVKRTAHAYRVGYYEQGFPPGLDATVFYPSVDFQFKNDTSANILIQAYTSGLTLYVDIYGTSDGRTVSLTQSVVSNQTPPPAELRQDDPTLPRGIVKQVDWSAWGATVTFQRTVTRNGQKIASEVWKSDYKPWQAVFLVGTQ